MNNLKKSIYLSTFLLLVTCTTTQEKNSAITEKVSIANSEVRQIYCKSIDQQYDILINLPGGYESSDKNYPVLFLLDAQWDFPLLSAIYGQQYYDGFIPELIIAGITWGGENANPDSLRQRDFTPTDQGMPGKFGGAPQFLKFIKDELIPFMDTAYRTTDQRILCGSSLGGLFTLYTLYTEPSLFYGYIPTAPALSWHNELLYSLFSDSIAPEDIFNARMFMAQGELDPLYQGFVKFTSLLEKNPPVGLSFEAKVLKGIGHSGVKAEGNTRGLQYIFRKPSISVDPEILKNYAGEYKAPDFNRLISIIFRNNQLIVNIPGLGEKKLSAETSTRFYVNGIFFNIEFSRAGETVSDLTLKTYGATYTLEKL